MLIDPQEPQQPTVAPEDFFGSRQHLRSLAEGYGLKRSSGKRTPRQNANVGGSPTSLHLVDEADDYSGPPDKMKAFADDVRRNYSGKLKELYHDPANIGYKDGKDIGPIGKHSDHVHLGYTSPGGGNSPAPSSLVPKVSLDDFFKRAVQTPPASGSKADWNPSRKPTRENTQAMIDELATNRHIKGAENSLAQSNDGRLTPAVPATPIRSTLFANDKPVARQIAPTRRLGDLNVPAPQFESFVSAAKPSAQEAARVPVRKVNEQMSVSAGKPYDESGLYREWYNARADGDVEAAQGLAEIFLKEYPESKYYHAVKVNTPKLQTMDRSNPTNAGANIPVQHILTLRGQGVSDDEILNRVNDAVGGQLGLSQTEMGTLRQKYGYDPTGDIINPKTQKPFKTAKETVDFLISAGRGNGGLTQFNIDSQLIAQIERDKGMYLRPTEELARAAGQGLHYAPSTYFKTEQQRQADPQGWLKQLGDMDEQQASALLMEIGRTRPVTDDELAAAGMSRSQMLNFVSGAGGVIGPMASYIGHATGSDTLEQLGFDAAHTSSSLGNVYGGAGVEDGQVFDTLKRALMLDPDAWKRIRNMTVSGAGSMLPFAVAPGGSIGAGATGVLSTVGSVYQEAVDAGVDKETAFRVSILAAPAGALEAFGVHSGSITKEIRRKVIGDFIKEVLKTASKGMVKEGLQEGAQQILQNMVRRGLINDDIELTEGVGPSMLAGAILGAVGEGGGRVVGHAVDRVAENREARQRQLQSEAPIRDLADVVGENLSQPSSMRPRLVRDGQPVQTNDFTTGQSERLPMPEPRETIAEQMNALVAGRRDAVVITPGSPMPEVPHGFVVTDTLKGQFIHSPEVVTPAEIQQRVEAGTYGELLGHTEQKGPDTNLSVVAREPGSGIEQQASYVSPERLPEQVDSLRRQFPGTEIEVGGADTEARVVQDRAARIELEQPIISPDEFFSQQSQQPVISPEEFFSETRSMEPSISPDEFFANRQSEEETAPVHHSQLQPRTAEGKFDGPPVQPEAVSLEGYEGALKPKADTAGPRIKVDDSLTTAIIKLGGIDPRTPEGSDIAKYLQGREGGRPGAMNRRGLGVDEMVEALRGEGWDIESPSDLVEAVRWEQSGQRVHSSEYDSVEAGQREVESQMEADAEGQVIQPRRARPTEAADLAEGETATSIKNATVDAERDARYMNPVEKTAGRSFGEVWESAKQSVNDGDVDPRSLAKELSEKPRPLSDVEDAALTYDRMRLQNAHKGVMNELEAAQEAGDTKAEASARARLDAIERDIETNDLAATKAGSENARGLNARRMMVKDDYSLARLIQRAKVEGGGEVPEATRIKLEEISKKLEAAESELAAKNTRIAKLEADRAIERTIRAEQRRARRTETREVIDKEYGDLKADFSKWAKKSLNQTNALFDAEGMKIVAKLARNRVRAGINTVEGLVDSLYNDLKDHIEGLTKRDVRDALSGYGRTAQMSKDEISSQLRELRQQARIISSIEDAQAGQRPAKSGLQRAPESRRVRELRGRLDEAMKRQGFKKEMSPEQRVELVRKRLESDIADLDRRINEGDFSPQKQSGRITTPEIEQLRARRQELKQQYDALKPDEAKTPRDPMPAIKTRLKNQIADLEQQLATGDFAEPQPRTPVVYDREAQALKARRDSLRAQAEREIQRLKYSTAAEALSTLRKAGLVSAVTTHLRNVLGTGVFQLTEEISRIPGSTLDVITGGITKQRGLTGPSVTANARAGYEAATDGVRQALEILKTGIPSESATGKNPLQLQRELNINPKIPGAKILNAYANGIFRLLSAEDRLIKVYSIRRALEGRAKAQALTEKKQGLLTESVRERAKYLRENPSVELIEGAIADGDVATFNNDNVVSTGIQNFRSGLRRGGLAGKAIDFGIDQIMPFDRTPTNILARMFEYTPIGIVGGGGRTVYRALAKRIADKAFTPEEQGRFAKTFGRGVTGSGLIALGYALAAAGMATGVYDDDDRAVNRANKEAGKSPMAIKVGDRWYQIGGFSPLGNLIAIGATMYEKPDNAALLIGRDALLDQPLLSGTADLLKASKSGDKLSDKAGYMVGSYIPSAVASVAQATDDKARKSFGFKGQIQKRIPGLRNLLPEDEGVQSSRLWAIDPFRTTTENKSAVLSEAAKAVKREYTSRLPEPGPMSEQDAEIIKLKRGIVDALRAGNKDEAREKIRAALNGGQISRKEAEFVIARGSKGELAHEFKQAYSLSEALDFIGDKSLTDDERKLLLPIVREKIEKIDMNTVRGSEKEALRSKVLDFVFTYPEAFPEYKRQIEQMRAAKATPAPQ